MADEITVPVTTNPNLDVPSMAALAAKIATNMKPLPEVLAELSITEAQYNDWVITHPFFKKTLEIAVVEWQSFSNTQQRLAIQAMYGAEYLLPKLVARIGDKNEPLPAAIEGMKALMRMAGIGDTHANQGPKERINIHIDLGAANKIVLHNEGTRDPGAYKTIEAEPSVGQVQLIPERKITRPALPGWGEAPDSGQPIRPVPAWTSEEGSVSGVTEGPSVSTAATGEEKT